MSNIVNTSAVYVNHQLKELELTRLKKCITRVAKPLDTLYPVFSVTV